MCDIPVPVQANISECASQAEADDPANISLSEAGTALATSKSSSIALDYSTDATTECLGLPKKITFFGPFPEGLTVCINCTKQIGPAAKYATPTDACIDKCKDLINFGGVPIPAEGTDAFCVAKAHVSTNYDKTMCDPRFAGACSDGGNALSNFDDPRRHPDKVMWIDTIGTSYDAVTHILKRTAATSVPADVDAGAASAEIIKSGDAWIEFQAGETGLTHVVGLKLSPCDDPLACPDTDATLNGLGFAISLNNDDQVYVLENTPTLQVHGPFGAYSANERYRVEALDNNDGTATISYWRLTAPCADGTDCAKELLFTSAAPSTIFPLRADALFREQDATVVNTTIVYIKQ